MYESDIRSTPNTSIRSRSRLVIAAGLVFALGWTSLSVVAAAPAEAATSTIDYELPNSDFSAPLDGTWTVTGTAQQERTLELAPSGVAYQGIPVTTDGSGPAVGDVVSAQIDVTLNADVTAASTVLVRVTDGSSILGEWTDLTSLPRGQRVTVTTQVVSNGGQIGASAGAVWVELHNDTSGTIEFHDVRVSAVRGSTPLTYAVPNGDFTQALNGSTNWSSGSARIATAVVLDADAVVSRTIPVGTDAALPSVGDDVVLAVDAFIDPRADAGTDPFALLSADNTSLIEAQDSSAVARATWQEITAVTTGSSVIDAGVSELGLELHNTTGYPLRLRDVSLSGVRDEGSNDLNGDGTVDAQDAAWFTDEVAAGTTDPALDYDDDGQVTTKDVSYFTRFVLGDASEVYANLAHLNFLSENVVLDGTPMMIVHLYSEPIDRSDLGQGYEWVGDPQEGVSALDDVARATIVYAEHYATYGDAHSYDQMKRGLEFAMWMQAPNGDFDNFVARDDDGNLFKKDSASSQTTFSYWAARAYEAMATALPMISSADSALADRLEARMLLCLNRIDELVSPEYGEYDASGAPKWLLFDDSWLSATAVSGLVLHAEQLTGDDRGTAVRLVDHLAEGIAYYQAGDFDEYPLGAPKHSNGNWYEWGSIQTKALALAGDLTGDEQYIDDAKLAADSFLSDMLISGRSMEVSPNKTGLPQINYGTASYVDNYLSLYAVTGEQKYADMAGVAATWWMGNNPINEPMFDQSLGLAFDGITIGGLNSNSGAESVDEALRAILRIQRVPEALVVMTATKVDERIATTVEIEDLFTEGRPDNTQLVLPNGGLNDPALAVVTQDPSSGVDERAVYEDSLAVTDEQPIYQDWVGANALFVEGSGYNNVRLFDDGYISTDIGVGGEGEAQPGDALLLDFSALLQFNTNLDAEVIAVTASGDEKVVADDSGFQYNARTWYSGAGSVRTTLLATLPVGTDHLTVRFSNESTNTNAFEGYATVTIASLYRLGVPEVRYGSTTFSNRSYAHMEANMSSSFAVDVPYSGNYNLFLSAVDSAGADAPTVTFSSPGRVDAEAELEGTTGAVTIRNIGRASLDAGSLPLEIATGAAAADLDALILYPVETYAVYELLDGRQVMVLRDADARALYTGTPEEVQNRGTAAPSVTTQPQDAAASAGGAVTFSAAATGDPEPTVQWQRKATGTDWTAIVGANNPILHLGAVNLADSGSRYRAVFTNRLGSATTETARLTVVVAKPSEPENWRDFVPRNTGQLLRLDPGSLNASRNGSLVTITGIPLSDSPWVHVFGFSAPVYVGAFLVEDGSIAVAVAGPSKGTHRLAVYDTNNNFQGYVTFTVTGRDKRL